MPSLVGLFGLLRGPVGLGGGGALPLGHVLQALLLHLGAGDTITRHQFNVD